MFKIKYIIENDLGDVIDQHSIGYQEDMETLLKELVKDICRRKPIKDNINIPHYNELSDIFKEEEDSLDFFLDWARSCDKVRVLAKIIAHLISKKEEE